MKPYRERLADPRYQEAVRLFDMAGLDKSWGMPSDPHARDLLRDACGSLAIDIADEAAAQWLTLGLDRYLGEKYRAAMRHDIERIARSAARTG